MVNYKEPGFRTRSSISFKNFLKILSMTLSFSWPKFKTKSFMIQKIHSKTFSSYPPNIYLFKVHSLHLGNNSPQKHPTLSFARPPLKSENCPSPLFRQSPLHIYWFFVNPPLKIEFSSEPIHYLTFNPHSKAWLKILSLNS